jgi:hypothetical protein
MEFHYITHIQGSLAFQQVHGITKETTEFLQFVQDQGSMWDENMKRNYALILKTLHVVAYT